MRLPFPGERNIRGPLDLIAPGLARHARPAGPGRPRREGQARASASRSSTTPVATGITVGPGGDIAWTPISSATTTRGSTATTACGDSTPATGSPGERAPAGPKYTRTGSVRQSWHDPLGFAGLDKVAPPSQAIPVLEARLAGARPGAMPTPRRRSRRSRPACRCSRRRSPPSAVEPGVETYRAARTVELRTGEAKLAAVPDQDRGARDGHRGGGRERVTALRAGLLDDPRAHLHHAAEPEPPAVAKRRAPGEAWAALSVGLLVAALAVVVWFRILLAGRRHRGAVRHLPRDRVVLPQGHARS